MKNLKKLKNIQWVKVSHLKNAYLKQLKINLIKLKSSKQLLS